jgi:threonine aldolase
MKMLGLTLYQPTAIAVENTHNFGGGTVQPISEIEKLSTRQRALVELRCTSMEHVSGMPMLHPVLHCLNSVFTLTLSASVSQRGLVRQLARSRWEVKNSLRRHVSGASVTVLGCVRLGLLAAAGHYALDHNIERLAEDHARAKKIAVALATHDSSLIDPETVDTNIVGLDLTHAGMSAADFAKLAAKRIIVWISALGKTYARLVTHLDFNDEQCDQAIAIMVKSLKVIERLRGARATPSYQTPGP